MYMSFKSKLQALFKAPSTDGENLEDEDAPFEWNQHARTMLAVVIVIFSAFILYWILS